jgi:arginase
VISLLSAPTNLGLRPPAPGSVPGCSKAPEALREAGLFRRFLELGAQDAGVVLPGRYVDDAAPDASRLRNQDQMVTFSRRLSDRISSLLDARHPLVVGGDCSLLIGVGHALRRRGGKVGLVHIDGHTDFRHPGNSPVCLSAAGEDLAILVGQHWDTIADIDGYRPYVPADQAIHVGCREDDEHLDEARQRVGLVVTASDLIADPSEALNRIGGALESAQCDTYWIHVDVDVLDPEFMPAVDSPDPGGIDPDLLIDLLRALAPNAVGADVAIYDPDLDPSGRYAAEVARIVEDGLSRLGSATPAVRPDESNV